MWGINVFFVCVSYHVCFDVRQEREQQIREFLNQPGREITRYGAHLRDNYMQLSKIGWTRGPVSQKSGNVSGLFRGPTIPLISLPRRFSKPLNFATLSVFLTFKRCWKISFSKQADFSLTTGFSARIVLGTFEKQAPATGVWFVQCCYLDWERLGEPRNVSKQDDTSRHFY